MSFRKILEKQVLEEQVSNRETATTISLNMENKVTLLEIEENPIQLIRDFGYKIKLETPKKHGKELLFFKPKDAESAYELIKNMYKKYDITIDNNKLYIALKV